MRITFICTDDIPYFTTGGVSMTSWGILDALLSHSHQVQVVTWATEHSDLASRISAIQTRGVRVAAMTSKVEDRPRTIDDVRKVAERITPAIVDFNPDVIVSFPWTGILWASGMDEAIPHVTFFGDLPHLVNINRIQYYQRHIPLTYPQMNDLCARVRRNKATYMPLLKTCAKIGNFCEHHAQWLQSQEIDCSYTQMPIVDSAFPVDIL